MVCRRGARERCGSAAPVNHSHKLSVSWEIEDGSDPYNPAAVEEVIDECRRIEYRSTDDTIMTLQDIL